MENHFEDDGGELDKRYVPFLLYVICGATKMKLLSLLVLIGLVSSKNVKLNEENIYLHY